MTKRWYHYLSVLVMFTLVLTGCGTPALPDANAPAAESGGEQAAAPDAAAEATGLKDIPRNRTLISAGLGGEHPGGFTDTYDLLDGIPEIPVFAPDMADIPSIKRNDCFSEFHHFFAGRINTGIIFQSRG